MKKTRLLALLLCGTMIFTACQETPATDDPATTDAPSVGGDVDASGFQAKALDDKTLEVKLVAQTPYFLELTAFPTYAPVPMHIIDKAGESWAVNAETYVGNGPYRMTEFVASSHILMEKNPNYWNYANLGDAETIKFTLIEDDVAQLNAFQTGELQFIDSLPQNEIANLAGTPEMNIMAQLGTYYVSFNNQKAPFDNALVRQAFSLAIDRDHIANVIGLGNYIPAGAWVAPGMADATAGSDFRNVGGDYYDPSKEAYAANLQKAKDLLAEAGYPNGEGLPTIEYIANDTSLHKSIAEALQSMWTELGATVTVDIQEWATFLNTRKNGEYMAARDGWLNDYADPIGVLDLFITGGGNNNSQYKNPDFDALITQIKTTSDQTERYALMHKAEDILMNDWVFAPIMYYGDPYMMNPDLKDSVWALPLGWKFFQFAKGYPNLNVCVGPNPDTIDPALNSAVDGGIMILHAFEGLYTQGADGTIVPGAAESVDISEDGLTYTFHLRDGLKFSDGTPLTAQTFVDSWLRAIDPATAADYSYMFECIAGYDTVAGAAEH